MASVHDSYIIGYVMYNIICMIPDKDYAVSVLRKFMDNLGSH